MRWDEYSGGVSGQEMDGSGGEREDVLEDGERGVCIVDEWEEDEEEEGDGC